MRRAPLACLMLLLGCPSTPTSVLLKIDAEEGVEPVEQLTLDIYSEHGWVVIKKRLPVCLDDPASTCDTGSEVELPSDVVLYPPHESGMLRILARAARGGSVVGEGTLGVMLDPGAQVTAMLLLTKGRLPDRDDDGVPDKIDNCPDQPNPDQGPCSPSPDGGVDGPMTMTDGSVPDGPVPDVPVPDAPADTTPPPDTMAPDLVPWQDTGTCTCPVGCKPGTNTCRQVVPSNGYSVNGFSKLPVISSTVSLDTVACELVVSGQQVKGSHQQDASKNVSACVLGLERLEITSSGQLTASGSYPLVLLVSKEVQISGLLDAGAHQNVPGPGGAKGGVPNSNGTGADGQGPGAGKVCTCTGGSGDDCGGGGAGHGAAGSAGGAEGSTCVQSTGGVGHGQSNLEPLSAGSGGGSGSSLPNNVFPGEGGAGGGALQISCQGTIEIDGAISVGGGGGQAGTTPAPSQGGIGGGGGGSGGGVLLEGAQITGTGTVAANGGAGGGGGGTSIMDNCGALGKDGEDADATPSAAKGGDPGGVSGAGGNGGAGGIGSFEGGATVQYCGGGGGGGAVGRIRLNWYKHSSKPPVQVSGSSSTGEVQAL